MTDVTLTSRSDVGFRPGPRAHTRQAFASACLAVLSVCALAQAKPPARPTVVLSGKAAPYLQAAQSLAEHLARRGHTARSVQLADLAATWQADSGRSGVYVAVGTRAATWLHSRVAGQGRLMYCMVAGPVRVGLTEKPPRHGVTTDVPIAEQFRIIAQSLPAARTVGMLYRSKLPRSRKILDLARKALPPGWRLHAVDIDALASVARAIEALLGAGVDVVWTAPDSSVYNVVTIRALLLGAMRRKKAVFGFSPAFVRAGALIGVGVSPRVQGEQAADLAARLLSDPAAPKVAPAGVTRAKVLPTPPKFKIAVNLIVAEKLSIELPRALVKRAGYVYKANQAGGR